MFKTTLLALTVSAFATSGALAVGNHPGVTLSKDKRITYVARGSTHYVPPSSLPGTRNAIFSNIGWKYPNGLYFCCYGNTISGTDSVLAFQSWVAMQFTPAADATIRKVDVAIGWFQGTNQVTIGIYDDNAGVPGTALAKKDVTGLPTGGTCCTLAVFKKKGVQVTAGTPYWVVVTTEDANDTFGFWNFNSTDQIDPVPAAYNSGTGWTASSSLPAPSFAVYAK